MLGYSYASPIREHMKRTELLLLNQIISDVGLMCNTSVDRDLQYVRSRVEKEGLSFLTITLPTFAKAIEKCLEQGFIELSLFRAFRKKGRSSGLIPTFLSGITSMIFDAEGKLRTDESIEAIDGVRQICLAFNKVKKECTNGRAKKALHAYIRCEDDLAGFRIQNWAFLRDFDRVSRLAFGGLFSSVERKLVGFELVPRHGPGAVVDGLKGNDKYRSLVWSRRLQRVMPYDQYLFGNTVDGAICGRGVVLTEPKDEPPVKVIFVPKTQKTPRVIAIEPTWNQYCQQALMSALVDGCEADPILGPAIHFTDSTINGAFARSASIDRSYATLDMSEASDRVHAALVHRLVRDYPDLSRAIFSSRSKRARLPTGQVIALKKFASMGSALCFPFEAFVFYTLALMGMHYADGTPFSTRSVKRYSRHLHVFGDDLILPVNQVSSIIKMLESVRLKVNTGKTFVTGFFRESCGVDAYKGHNVTPVYVREECPTSRQDARQLASMVATANLFYKKGYWKTAKHIREQIIGKICQLPHVLETSALLGYFSFLGSYTIEKWDTVNHRYLTRGLTLKVKDYGDELVGSRRLFKFFLTRNEKPVEVESFTKSVRRGSVYTKSRWVTPY
jgi:hypothetical protein